METAPEPTRGAQKRLTEILRKASMQPSSTKIRALGQIAEQIARMDFERKQFRRGRPSDICGDALIEKLYDFWVAVKGRPPGISRPGASEGPAHGPFVRLTQSLAAEILHDLETQHPLKERNALRTSLDQLANRSEKVSERLKAVRRFWKLPASDWIAHLDPPATEDEKE